MRIKYKKDKTVEIEFLNGEKALIDKEDLLLFAQFNWYVVDSHKTKYLKRNGVNKTIGFHGQLMNTPKGMDTDHINGNGLDNRKCNLRVVSHLENQNNFKNAQSGKSKYRYVHWCSTRGTWRARLTYKNKKHYIGQFDNEAAAALAANNFIITNKIEKVLNEL